MKILLLICVAVSSCALLFFYSHLSFASIGLFALVALSGAYVVDIFLGGRLPRFFRHGAYFACILVLSAALLDTVGLLYFFSAAVPFGTLISSRVVIEVAIFSIVAPLGLYAIWRTNRNLAVRAGSFWKGLVVASALMLPLFAAEHLWIRHHQNQLRNGQSEEITGSLDSLSRYPFRARVWGSVCEHLFLRDITDRYFMYVEGDTVFLPDGGQSKIEAALAKRLGSASPKVIESARAAFGKDIVLNCTRWNSPT